MFAFAPRPQMLRTRLPVPVIATQGENSYVVFVAELI